MAEKLHAVAPHSDYPTLRRLFRGPVRVECNLYVFDADTNAVASKFEEGWVARGWGRIQYLDDGHALMNAWEAEFSRLTAGLETGEQIAAAINAALGAGEQTT